jgi:hypothetical protein
MTTYRRASDQCTRKTLRAPGRPPACLPGSVRITAGSGKLSLWAARARGPPRMPGYQCPLVRAGFGVQEVCRQRILRRQRSRRWAALSVQGTLQSRASRIAESPRKAKQKPEARQPFKWCS